ncbi:MAG: hypothetical protein COA49_04015 [Bacteroidetes bacterium]|nr:MAG: hypothetical protein COA49_04015 [Bacteroidota bacterium]
MIKLQFFTICFLAQVVCFSQVQVPMEEIRKGEFIPLYGSDTISVVVDDFLLDTYPVTNQQYLDFVQKNPKWKKSKVIKLFAEASYLSQWENDTTLGNLVNPLSPVTSVSWFSAKAYCRCQGKRLPTMNEWEYVAMANQTDRNAQKDSLFNQKITSGYESPKTYRRSVGSTFRNYWGVWDMHGLIWEWTSDFNSVIISGESRNSKNADGQLFCAGASVGASDLMNYAAFMRYAFRSSVKANYCILNLGFRCAKD